MAEGFNRLDEFGDLFGDLRFGEAESLIGIESVVLGRGSFGTVYAGWYAGEPAAIKVELRHLVTNHRFKPLEREWAIMQRLQGLPGVVAGLGFEERAEMSVLALPLCGPSLGELKRAFPQRRVPLQHMLVIAPRMIALLELVHSRGVTHRDVKPDNFLVATDFRSPHGAFSLHLIDFGLSKLYVDESGEPGAHIPCTEKEYTRGVSGTPRYCSLNSHLCNEQSRRDDLEACGYCILWLVRGTVPWQGIQMPSKWLKLKAIFERKRMVNIEKVCADVLPELAEHILYCRQLSFTATPDYAYLKNLYTRSWERLYPGVPPPQQLVWPRRSSLQRLRDQLTTLLHCHRREHSELEDILPYVDTAEQKASAELHERCWRPRIWGMLLTRDVPSAVWALFCTKRSSSPPPERIPVAADEDARAVGHESAVPRRARGDDLVPV